MDKSFDLGALLKKHGKRHKSKPVQFESVAGGVKKRMEECIKTRKSNRRTMFDNIRKLSESRCPSPVLVPVPEPLSKMERRKQQLEKWKEEKMKKKKDEAAQKKKPFVAGVTHNPLNYVPPPPPPRPVPSSSGRVTRSQSRRNKEVKEAKESQSFAPKNAVFRPPKLKSATVLNLQPVKPKKKETLSFAPIPPKPSCSKTYTKKPVERPSRIKPAQTKNTGKTIYCQSSSSENEVTVSTSSFSSNKQSSSENEGITLQFSSDESPQKSLQSSSSSEIEKGPVVTKSPKPKTKKSSTPKVSKLAEEVELMTFTPMKPVPKSESSSEEKLRSPKEALTPQQVVDLVKNISPCVTLSRGKDKARKEMKEKLKQGLLDEDASDMDSVVYFKRQLASEMDRLSDKCVQWEKISEQTVLPEFAQELLLAAVGQARLLMSKKLAQFGSLVQRCETGDCSSGQVTAADLRGFWDMVFMQVVNIDMRFKKLEDLQARNWVEEQLPTKPKVVKPVAKPASKPAAKPKPGNSRLKEMIAAARAAKKQENPPPQADEKTFDAGFFSVRSPARKPTAALIANASGGSTPATPRNKNNLLKAVLSSEAKKSANKASFAMLRASAFGRNECDGVAPLLQTPLQPINISATPGRSILKQSQDSTNKASRPIKVVLFDEDDIQTDAALAKDNENEADLEGNTHLDSEADLESNTNLEVESNLESQANLDSGVSSMEVEKGEKENKSPRKEHSSRKSKLIRQNALEDRSPVLTRSRRKSIQTPKTEEKVKKTSRKSKVLKDSDDNILDNITPRRSTRSRKSVV